MKNEWTEFSIWDEDFATIKNIIMEKISIFSLLEIYGIEYYQINSGNFTHRLKCPFAFHKGGDEATPSFFVSETTKTFHCFGCNSNGNVIDFYKYYNNVCFNVAIGELGKMLKINKNNINNIQLAPKKKPEETVAFYISKLGIELRDFLKSKKNEKKYTKYEDWVDRQFVCLDEMLNWSDDKWEEAKNKYDNINKKINK